MLPRIILTCVSLLILTTLSACRSVPDKPPFVDYAPPSP